MFQQVLNPAIPSKDPTSVTQSDFNATHLSRGKEWADSLPQGCQRSLQPRSLPGCPSLPACHGLEQLLEDH